MTDPLSHTAHGDAPLSAAKNPDSDELIGRTVTINRPRAELYAFWRRFGNLSQFMQNIQQVEEIDAVSSHWVVRAPAGQTVEWEALVTDDEPDRLIAWTAAAGASVPNSGRVEFRDAPPGRGTEVTATIVYQPPAGALGKLIAKLFQREPKIQARQDLRRFKQLMEAGEIAVSHLQP